MCEERFLQKVYHVATGFLAGCDQASSPAGMRLVNRRGRSVRMALANSESMVTSNLKVTLPMRSLSAILALVVTACVLSSGGAAEKRVAWKRLSSTTGDLAAPNSGDQQTCCVVLDIDGDGADDFVIGERTQAPSVVWYRLTKKGWERHVIDDTKLQPEAGGAACDVDGDGDRDLILGQDSSGPNIWWWENPRPRFDRPWARYQIKTSGGKKHHDQTAADYDHDGRVELVTWNQKAKSLLWYEVPMDPREAAAWVPVAIYRWESGEEHEGFPSRPVDVNLDGKLDLVGGGRWFEHRGGEEFEVHGIDDVMRFTQCAAGQLVNGGRPEIVFSPGDTDGDAKWYRWDGSQWQANSLGFIVHGHTCETGDIDGDGNDDIFIGEMGSPGAGDKARLLIWYGDGQGGFQEQTVATGQGIHEGLLGDFDGDGDLDIVAKPYHHNAPRLDVYLNEG